MVRLEFQRTNSGGCMEMVWKGIIRGSETNQEAVPIVMRDDEGPDLRQWGVDLKQHVWDILGINGEGQDRVRAILRGLICLLGWMVVPFSDKGLNERGAGFGERLMNFDT